MPVKLISTSDLHQYPPKWHQLARVIAQEKPRYGLVAGDLLPKDGGYIKQQCR